MFADSLPILTIDVQRSNATRHVAVELGDWGVFPRTTVLTIAVACASAVASACSDSALRTAEGYCGEVQTQSVAINSPAIASANDIETTLAVYRSIADRAPATIEPEWRTVIAGLETAATVVTADPVSMARMNDAALSGQPAYTRIQQYTSLTCGTDIGGTPPPATNPVTVTVTTVPGG